MSGYQASCPACGATIVFALGSSLLRVCEHCGVALARKGANLANYGKVADLIPTASVLALGMAPVETEINRLDNQALVRYYEAEWRRWN